MPWLEYEVDEVDPDALAEWEAADPDDKGDKPEPQSVTKTVEVPGEARLTFAAADGYQNISVGPGGVTSIKVLEEAPAEVAEAAQAEEKSGNGRRKTSE